MPRRSSRSTDPVRLAYAREPVLITRAPIAAATNADAVDRLNVLGPPPVPTMLTVRRDGGSGRGLRCLSELSRLATEAPSGIRVVNDDSTASASPGCNCLAARRSQKSPHTSSAIG